MTLKSKILAGAVLLAFGAQAATAAIPRSGTLTFDVIRKGQDIGDISYVFSRKNKTINVKIHTDIVVKAPIIGITMYSFQQNSAERWQDDRLIGLASNTNDNGTRHSTKSGPTNLIPASLWNDAIVNQTSLLNTINGNVMNVRVQKLGTAQVKTQSGTVRATHYTLTGGLERELWFDANGVLAQVRFNAEDGSVVTYVRR